MNWNQLHSREIVKENPVIGINTVELLERMSNYLNEKENYFARIKKSLAFIPKEYKDAALAIFSNVIYIPDEFIKATYHFFGTSFKEKYHLHSAEEIGQSTHVFEVDPSGMKNKFYQVNAIYQRLHPDYYARIHDITDVAKVLIDLFHKEEDVIEHACHEIIKIGKKHHWIILTDKALSGQSLVNDIARYLLFRDIIQEVTGNCPLISVNAQVITSDAVKATNTALAGVQKVNLEYAILFPESMKINAERCELFNSAKIHAEAQQLCCWLADEVMYPDERFNTMREKSGDHLPYGYKGCGITLVDFSNCPTNSVPLLWYDNTDRPLKQKYKGPFPRVQSRLGIQLEQPVGNAWKKVAERKDNIIDILKKYK